MSKNTVLLPAIMYKLILKILTSKLKSVVHYIVSPSQSVFICCRNILDNVVVAHEIVKEYSQKGVSPRYTIKVDIRKAYNPME